MASTNKTTHYELSQFLGTDKPAWLGDYNSDMQKIDTGINTAQTTATGADGKADAATTAIGDLTNLTTTAKTTVVAAINEVDSDVATAQNTATSAAQESALNTSKIGSLENYLNLNTFTTPTVTVTGGTLYPTSSISCASNNTGTLGKIYGWLRVTANSNNVTISFATPLRPSEAITVNGLVVSQADGASITMRSVTIATDGTATITISDTASGAVWRLDVIAALIFAQSFGDVPIPE